MSVPPIVDADTALRHVQSGHRVYLHEAAMAPFELIDALCRRAMDLTGVETVSLHTEGPAPHVDPALQGHLRHNALFVGSNIREAVNAGRADYTPVFLSQIPALFRGPLPLDVALLQITPPDAHGFCRLGTSIACARAASDAARIVIGLINHRAPAVMGASAIHISRFAALAETDRLLPVHQLAPVGPVEQKIGEHVAALIPDRSTLQLGIGGIPNGVLASLADREDLGVHTEMFSDGLVDLVDRGVITNRYKNTWNGRIVTSFAVGSQRLYDFVDSNPFVEFHPSDIVNDTREIRKIDGMVAVNSALEIDLTGQVVADSIGEAIYSGIGGQMDFVRGAQLARNGRAVLALPSTAAGGTVSRIVPTVKPGAGVVTTRGHVQYVATEYGVVDLSGQPIRRRAELLASIAHPDFRNELLDSLKQRFHLMPPLR